MIPIDISQCIDCNTKRYLIYPYGNETLIICSACYRLRNILLEEKKRLDKCLINYCSSAILN